MGVNKVILLLATVFLLFISACSNMESIPMEVRERMMDQAMEKDPPIDMTAGQQAVEENVAMAMSDGKTLKSGSFEGKAHPTMGTAKIIKKDGQKVLVISDDFKSDRGPRLKVILSSNPNPTNSKEVHEGDYIDVGKLKSTKGTQTYHIEKDGDYNSVIIYCQPFKVIFGIAQLQ